MKSSLLAGAAGEPITLLAAKAAPSARTIPTATEAAISTKRDTTILLGLGVSPCERRSSYRQVAKRATTLGWGLAKGNMYVQ